MTFPDQYIYNPAFHLKVMFLGLAGANVLVFYAITYRHVNMPGLDNAIPLRARVAGVVSLICWTAIIILGRLITFYRPNNCQPDDPIAFLSRCFP
jgi:hypothetical protein